MGSPRSLGLQCAWIALAAALSGCDSVPLAGFQYAVATWRGVDASVEPALGAPFDYLRVAHPGGVAWLALGNVEAATPGNSGAAVQVWYSAAGQVLRVQGGRIVSSTGLPTDWLLSSNSQPPDWRLVARSGTGTYLRTRHGMPDYAFNQQDVATVTHKSSGPPGWVGRIRGVDAKRWTWFTEESTNLAVTGTAASLPRAWFAVDLNQPDAPVMASIQCLPADFCLDVQALPKPR